MKRPTYCHTQEVGRNSSSSLKLLAQPDYRDYQDVCLKFQSCAQFIYIFQSVPSFGGCALLPQAAFQVLC